MLLRERVNRSGRPRADATVVFDTVGHFDPELQRWVVPLHVWVYRPQDSKVRKTLIARLFDRRYGLSAGPEAAPLFDRRVNLLLANNLGRRTATLDLAGQVLVMPATRANGHSTLEAVLPPSIAAPETGAVLPILLVGGGSSGGPRSSHRARAHLVPPEGVSIISDIDDTVKETGVIDKAQLWRMTFYEPFRAVPGMVDLLRRLGGGTSAPVHYVSSSPWHLYAPLTEWLAADGFPVSSLHLKQIRLKDRTLFDITRSPTKTKPPKIRRLLERFPKRRFILVGDSSEKDPEIYGAVARQYPGRVSRILIRRAPGDRSDARRFEAAFAGLPGVACELFDDPATVV